MTKYDLSLVSIQDTIEALEKISGLHKREDSHLSSFPFANLKGEGSQEELGDTLPVALTLSLATFALSRPTSIHPESFRLRQKEAKEQWGYLSKHGAFREHSEGARLNELVSTLSSRVYLPDGIIPRLYIWSPHNARSLPESPYAMTLPDGKIIVTTLSLELKEGARKNHRTSCLDIVVAHELGHIPYELLIPSSENGDRTFFRKLGGMLLSVRDRDYTQVAKWIEEIRKVEQLLRELRADITGASLLRQIGISTNEIVGGYRQWESWLPHDTFMKKKADVVETWLASHNPWWISSLGDKL